MNDLYAEEMAHQNREIIRLLRVLVVLTMQVPMVVKAVEEGSAPEVCMDLLDQQLAGIDGELKS